MKIKPVEEISAYLSEIAAEQGLKIVEVEFKQGKDPALTIYIDKDGGVDLDACERFHRAIDQPLDTLDPTYGQAYTLNVSSLGIDRPFKSDEDFISHIGTRIEVKLNSSIKGKKFYDGILMGYDKKVITLKVNEKDTFTIDLKNLAKANEYIEFI